MNKNLLPGVAVLMVSVLAWGAQSPVSKLALDHVDGYWLTAIRHFAALPVFVLMLALTEGRRAFSYGGRLGTAMLYGSYGAVGFGLLFFLGVAHTLPEHAVIILSLQPAITALWQWARSGLRPPAFTLGCTLLCLVGLLLVVTKGEFSLAAGGTWFGDLLVLGAAFAWIGYTFGVAKFPDWSPLRFTTLCALPASLAVLLALGVAAALGDTGVPDGAGIAAAGWHIAYLVIFTAILANLCWNAGVRKIGALNALLVGNLVPVVTFAIRIAQGRQFAFIELLGAGLVVASLVANNLYVRQGLK